MEEAERNARLAQLTAEMAWLRALARALLRNDDAGDLAHDAWLIAAERGPTDDRPIRPWLTRVVVNLSRMQARARRRREAREAATSIADVVPDPETLVERVELQRLIAGEVLQLKEPYRSTVLLHFFEELSCADIARRCGLPEGTVRRRLKVALDELRARIDAEDPKSGRVALLAPLAGMPTPPLPAPFALGIVAMKKIVAAVVLLVLLLVGALLWRSHEKDPRGFSDAVNDSAPPTSAFHQKIDGTPAALPAWFSTSNAATRRIAGRVTLNGTPVKDAIVSLQSELTRAEYAAPIERHTDARGAFDFGMQVAARYDVAASSPGTTAALLTIDLANPALKPPADRVELQLHDCSISVSGTIYDASNNPLPKVNVKRLGDRYNVPSRGGIVGVESDARGAYRICVPFGDTEVEYSADGFGTVILTIDARGEMYRDVVLVPDASVSVQVVRADNGEPVGNAHVFVSPSEWAADRAAQRTGITDREGRVRIEGFVPGRFQAWAYAEGLQARGPVEVLTEIGTLAEVVVKLETMARITGKVVDGDKPVPGVQIIANRTSPVARTQPVFSQADGSFVIDRVPPGDISFIAAPYEVTSPAQLSVEAGKAYSVVISVHSLGAIRGQVTRLGKPAANVDVCCIGTLFPADVKTDADGTYEFLGVPAGKYPINAASEFLGAFTLGTTVTLAAGEQRVLDLELDQAGTIAGTVVDREGKPVKGVFVRWINEKTGDLGRSITDTHGRYRCGAMTGGGTYRASVHASSGLQAYPTADGGSYPTVEVKDGRTVIEGVVLAIDRSQLSVSGHVVDDAGSPIADALVKALPISGGQTQFHSWMRLAMSSTDANGEFTIRGLLSGPHSLQARGASGAEGTVSPIDAGASGLTIRVASPGSIEGRLVGFTQTPEVYVRPLADLRYVAATIDGTTYRISGLTPGRYLVDAQTTQEGEAKIVEVRGGQVARVDLTSQGRATIDGTVLNFRTRAPIPNASCYALMSVDGLQGTTSVYPTSGPKSDAEGRVRLDPAPAGSVTVACRIPAPRYSHPSTDVTVPAGGRANVQLLAVEMQIENPSTIGALFDVRTTAPRITGIVPNGPAAKAGMQVGDLITQVNDASVQGLNGGGAMWLINSVTAGDEVRITVSRGGATKTLTMRTVADL